ncbi:MAG: transcriptional regulator [Candidatus Margulisiibacteriota bacterium]|nr:MAG: hypothetical protein A2X43_03995 [Candidatus Margulisbacteria bacterium GWD2_39_127]OGI05164.1 MAG: hypothetical protein A2X42_02505 [Candidatus Margulisbacteria bacterium GWF2_38_17]OGI06213.1 MAG: hypothetical protein A2X41_08085 [Candidatus Margulisbacteria bacterium GWE2_39_32]PZM78869.1 MAG: transcriptional regulator [Candidatus Margulisiibacteriota bacterium]HAR64551.1 transcriptional regulator [Candidatus Margulisiibacteriota bacterium]
MVVKKKTFKIANTIKAMSHPARLQILEDLIPAKDGFNVSTIQKLLKIPQSAVSQHLSLLKTSGILDSRRNGVEIFYYIKDEKTKELIEHILSL